MGNFIDLSGQTFGVYYVLNKNTPISNEKGRIFWNCQCLNCKNETVVRTDLLKRKPSSCPNCRYPNLIGQRFGRLTVYEKGKVDSNGHRYWQCLCDCGKQVELSGTNLIEGKTQSCGCLHKEITSITHLNDLTGQVFGKLTVLCRDENNFSNRVKWQCLCECGNKISVQANNLISGHTISCGCTQSKGEYFIRQKLIENNISFATQYIFSDLPKLRFDFAIFKENQLYCLIEYDGKQHFKYIPAWHKTEEQFEQAKARDDIKNNYCNSKNIKLYRISYLDNLEKKIETIIQKYNIQNQEKEEVNDN